MLTGFLIESRQDNVNALRAVRDDTALLDEYNKARDTNFTHEEVVLAVDFLEFMEQNPAQAEVLIKRAQQQAQVAQPAK